MDKKNSTVILGILILLILPLVYAGNYGALSYNKNNYDVGEVLATSPSGGSSSGGGGSFPVSTINSTHECIINSDCNKTQYCFENACYKAECFNDSVCDVNAGETCRNHTCVKLFDVVIKDFESPVKSGETFGFTYLIKGMANLSDDVEVRFWIEKDNKVVSSGSDTIYFGSFEEKTKKANLFLPSNTSSGTYVFFVQVVHGAYKVSSHRTIEIMGRGVAKDRPYIASSLVGIGIFILLFLFYLERKNTKRIIMSKKRWVEKYKITLSCSLLFAILGTLIYYFKWYKLIVDWGLSVDLWGKINILPYIISYGYYILGGIILLGALVISIIMGIKRWSFKKFREVGKKRNNKTKTKNVKPQIIEKKGYAKGFFKKYRALLSVTLLVILAGVISYLFYAGILTVGDLRNIWGWFRGIWEGIVNGLIATTDWIGKNWLYLIIGAGSVVLGLW